MIMKLNINDRAALAIKNNTKRVEIREMPNTTFVYDESIEYANHIEKIIEGIEKHE